MFDTYYIKHKKYIEQIKEDIDDAEKVLSTPGAINLKSFDLHDELNKKIWDLNNNLRHDIREDLINIAGDFYDTLDIAEITGEEDQITDTNKDKTFQKYIKDVLFVGSLASFNYSSYADIDLHLLMDENLLVGNNKLALNILKKYFTECKNDWNLKHSDLKIEGYDVELYVQDMNEVNASNGVYSLMNDEWVKQPQKLETANFDRDWVQKKALSYIEQIDNLEETLRSHPDFDVVKQIKDELKKIKDKIVQGRRDSLAAGYGEMNSYNILFKILRRSGHIEKINNLVVAAYDLLNSIDNKKDLTQKQESNAMKLEKLTEAEIDAMAEFEIMYSQKALKALKAYLSKRTSKKADEILNDDDEFDKFANWAYKHLNIDVYEKFAKYDKGTLYKRTSTLLKDPEQSGDKRFDTRPGDDTRFSYEVDGIGDRFDRDDTIDWDKQFPDTAEESIIVKEDGEYIPREMEIREILNTRWEDPLDADIEEEPYKYRFIISIEVGKVARFLDKALEKYAKTHDKKAFMDNVHYVANTYSGVEVPDEVIDSYGEKIMALVDVKGESITVVEDGEAEKSDDAEQKAKVVIGKVDDNSTMIIVSSEPKDDENKILKTFGGEKWEKDNGGFWYFTAQKKFDDVKTELEKNFSQKFSIEVRESNDDSTKEEAQPEQNQQQTANEQPSSPVEEKPVEQPAAAQEPQTTAPEQTASDGAPKITGSSWEEFLKNIEEQSIYKVDSAFRRHPNQWIELIDDTGKIYDGEVNTYSDGAFELLYSNIHPVPNAEESKKQTPINESYADDAIDNIKDVLKKYFEVDPETEEENPQFDENFTAQEALDEIVDILY